MAIKRKIIKALTLAMGLLLMSDYVLAGTDCQPCGEVITNLPMPCANPCDCNSVQPLQNYIATYQPCAIGCLSGFYVGTGVGFGAINYNLKIPGISLPKEYNGSYVTEFASLGYAFNRSGFFLGVELAYYYDSTVRPFFYEDPSSFSLVRVGLLPIFDSSVTVSPCTARLDINANNHVAVDLMPGFVLGQRLTLFGRLGFEFTTYSWQRRICFPDVSILATPLVGIPFELFVDDQEFGDKESSGVVDLRLGAGISFAACRHVNFNVNYVHIVGSKASFKPNMTALLANAPIVVDPLTGNTFDATVVSNLTTLAAEQTINPSRNEILVGVTFNF